MKRAITYALVPFSGRYIGMTNAQLRKAEKLFGHEACGVVHVSESRAAKVLGVSLRKLRAYKKTGTILISGTQAATP